MKKKLSALILALAVMLALTACNTDDTPAGDASPTPSAEVSPSSETPDVSDSDFAYVSGKGTLIIGYTVYEPMNYTDSDGNFTGFDTELALLVCEELGFTPEFVEIDWLSKEVELKAKSIDCVWNGLTIDEPRKQEMEITVPYVKNAQVVVMKADAAYDGVESLADKTVCAEAGSAGETTISKDDYLSQAEYIAKEVQTACLIEVAAGTVDAAVLDLTLASAMIGSDTDYSNLAIVDFLAIEDYGVAFRKGSDICEKVNDIFADLKADGTMAALADKYNLALAD